jgi:hypothetical protein
MIPKGIKNEHILAAIAEIDRDGIPSGRQPTKFELVHQGRKYPPKYVLTLAAKYARGTQLNPDSFGGGTEANSFLRARGFQVKPIDGGAAMPVTIAKPPEKLATSSRKRVSASSHDERCSECKTTVKSLLEEIYCAVEKNFKIQASTSPEEYRDSPLYLSLSGIYTALQEHRGYKDFVRSPTMPNCDFWVPNPGFVVEFDESQHFTDCRALALERYPGDITFGFDRDSWLSHCRTICAEDHDPPFRDEQRAWYDTLRDYVPHVKGLHPTLRLFASEFEWCSLKPEKGRDVETFRQILAERANFWRLEFSNDASPVLGRVILDGPWRGDIQTAVRLLEDICAHWPKGRKVECLTTCGAFLRFDWPTNVQKQTDNRFPDQEAMAVLEKEGRKCCNLLLQDSLVERLRRCTEYITLGVDTFKEKISTTQAHIPEPHAELVYVADLTNRTLHFTAKSYPTTGQQEGLLRNTNLGNHFLELGGNRTMILGCHDLTIFNPRSDAKATGWRFDVKQEFKDFAAKYKPRWVLHHPHTAIKKRTWLAAWGGLTRSLPSVESYASSGTYSRKDSGWEERNSLREVLSSTKTKDVMDIIAHVAQPYPS